MKPTREGQKKRCEFRPLNEGTRGQRKRRCGLGGRTLHRTKSEHPNPPTTRQEKSKDPNRKPQQVFFYSLPCRGWPPSPPVLQDLALLLEDHDVVQGEDHVVLDLREHEKRATRRISGGGRTTIKFSNPLPGPRRESRARRLRRFTWLPLIMEVSSCVRAQGSRASNPGPVRGAPWAGRRFRESTLVEHRMVVGRAPEPLPIVPHSRSSRHFIAHTNICHLFEGAFPRDETPTWRKTSKSSSLVFMYTRCWTGKKQPNKSRRT